MTPKKSAIQKKSVLTFMTLLQSLIFFAFHFQNFESLLKTTYYSQFFYCGEFSYHEDQKKKNKKNKKKQKMKCFVTNALCFQQNIKKMKKFLKF